MRNVVYLIGAGAIQGEMTQEGIESNITMTGISNGVFEMSKDSDGEYYKLLSKFGIPKNQDVELMMSLFENLVDSQANVLNSVNQELKSLFRSYLISQIPRKLTVPKLLISLLHIHHEYDQHMGKAGEKLLGILTINYDSTIEDAFSRIYGGLNCGYDFESDGYTLDNSLPPLLKLHGSFNWKVRDDELIISKAFEREDYEDDYSGWIPPSVYKRPSEAKIFKEIWNKSRKLLIECDTLRVVGSSLRNEDWPLITLIFTSQILGKVFDIELIIPQHSAVGDEFRPEVGPGVMQRLPFLGKVRPLADLQIFQEHQLDVNMFSSNVFYHWLDYKTREIDIKTRSISEDSLINEMLYGE